MAARSDAVPGAYLLVIELGSDLPIRIGARPEAVLLPGRYGYCGSARGPGGLGARVRRHCRKGKRPHWQVDRLTEAGRIVEVQLLPNGSECALVRVLLAQPNVRVPVPGFGSSDCRGCPAHLVSLPADRSIASLLAGLPLQIFDRDAALAECRRTTVSIVADRR